MSVGMFDSGGPVNIIETIQAPTLETTMEDGEYSAETIQNSRELLGFNTITNETHDSGVPSARQTL